MSGRKKKDADNPSANNEDRPDETGDIAVGGVEQNDSTGSGGSDIEARVKHLETALTDINASQQALGKDMNMLNQNLIIAFKNVEQTIKQLPQGMIQGLEQYQKQHQQPTQGQQMQAGQKMEGTDGKEYYNPNQQQQQMSDKQGQMMMYLVDKLTMPDPNSNIFAQLGSRVFTEMVLGNMYNNRANNRLLLKKGLLTEEEVNDMDTVQKRLYAPLIGARAGEPQQDANAKQSTP